jgi:hypothetical protein
MIKDAMTAAGYSLPFEMRDLPGVVLSVDKVCEWKSKCLIIGDVPGMGLMMRVELRG